MSILSILAVGSLVLAGCSKESQNPAEGITLQVPGEVTAAPADSQAEEPRAPGNPCENARGACESVAIVDVDGGGRPDDVGIELWDGRIVVRIDTGSELAMIDVEDQHIIRTDLTPSGVFVGAFPITRADAADVVVDAKFGLGGYELFAVVSWDDGPVLAPAPEGARAPTGGASEWAFPTEEFTVLARCPEPGSIEILTSQGDSSFGDPVPGGAYTETVTSRWAEGRWASATAQRVAGETMRSGKVARTSTFECDAVHLPPIESSPAAVEETAPAEVDNVVFGGAPLSNSEGFGRVRPPVVFFGGSPSGMVFDVVWQSWGGDRAVGQGTAGFVEVGSSVAEALPLPAEVVAFDIAECDGVRAYSKVQWYFPSRGESFDPENANDVC